MDCDVLGYSQADCTSPHLPHTQSHHAELSQTDWFKAIFTSGWYDTFQNIFLALTPQSSQSLYLCHCISLLVQIPSSLHRQAGSRHDIGAAAQASAAAGSYIFAAAVLVLVLVFIEEFSRPAGLVRMCAAAGLPAELLPLLL